MKTIYSIFLLSLFAVSTYAQNPEISVLFIGNSLTNGNSTNETNANLGDVYPTADCGTSMAYEFIQISESMGFNVHVEMYAPNGKYIHDDPQNASNIGHCNSTVTESYINSRQWDYVVVQDNAGAYMWDEGSFSSFVPPAQKTLHDKIILNNPCTKEILYATQGYYDGMPSAYWSYFDPALTYDNNVQSGIRSYRNHLVINDYYPLHIVSPIGLAWNRYCNDGHSKNDLYYDTAHPTDKASYLNASVVFATIFKMDISGLSSIYTGGYSDAAYLNQIAYETVMDNTIFAETNLDAYTPEISFASNEISVDNSFSSYQWYLSPSQIEDATNQAYTITETGWYFAEVTGTDGCEMRSEILNFDYVTGINTLGTNDGIQLFPNPARSIINIEGLEYNSKIQLINMQGQIVKQLDSTSTINIDDLPNGNYNIRILTGSKIVSKRFQKM